MIVAIARRGLLALLCLFGLFGPFVSAPPQASAAPPDAIAGWTRLYSQSGATNAATALSADGTTLFWTQYYNGASSGVFMRRLDGAVTRLSNLNFGSGLLALDGDTLLWSRVSDGLVRKATLSTGGVATYYPASAFTGALGINSDIDIGGIDRAPVGTFAHPLIYDGDIVITDVGVPSSPIDDAIYACTPGGGCVAITKN